MLSGELESRVRKRHYLYDHIQRRSDKNTMEEDQNVTATFLEPDEMKEFVSENVQLQNGFNNIERDEAFANLSQIWIELGMIYPFLKYICDFYFLLKS